jgi:hypothetical protein
VIMAHERQRPAIQVLADDDDRLVERVPMHFS